MDMSFHGEFGCGADRSWKACTSSRLRRSGERPKYRLNFDTALRYDCCVAGDRLRTVMSSIMRRRRGLISAIGNLLSEGLGTKNPGSFQTGGDCGRSLTAAQAASFNQDCAFVLGLESMLLRDSPQNAFS